MTGFAFLGGFARASSSQELATHVFDRHPFGSGLSQSVVSLGEVIAALDDWEAAIFFAQNIVATECEELANRIGNKAESNQSNQHLHFKLILLQSWEKDLRLMLQEHLRSRFERWSFLFKDHADVCQGFEVVVYLRCTRGVIRPKEIFPRAPIEWDEMITVVKGSSPQA